MSDLLLDAQGVYKRFGGLTAVRDVNLQIPRRAIASLIGPNGAGKTTFFNCITGFYMPEEGQIILDGRSIRGLRPDKIMQRGIARTYQNIRLFGSMTVIENVLVGMHTRLHAHPVAAVIGTSGARHEEFEALEHAVALLENVGLGEASGDWLAQNL
ncbi:MAG: ABC transporter ATP-binding protein, partial [Anaerolineae bacterium]|nr:ABC transporter ATP-binding protein [Anaerolineae bacterium]